MNVEQLTSHYGWLLTFGYCFVMGLAMNLTPCVYPMIPITVSYFGGMSEQNSRRAPFMALLFVLGMAVSYSALGVFAAMTGRLFGAELGNPWVVGFVSIVLIGMALSMFGVFQMTASSNTLTAISDIRDRLGAVGALFFGLTIGVVMAPCVGPFLTGLLTYVAAHRDPLLGFWMFFTLAMGMGLPYLILGTFSGGLKALPRPGPWMVWLEHVFAFVFIGMALKFWLPFMPRGVAAVALPAFGMLAAVFLGFIDRTAEGSPEAPPPIRRFRVAKRILGVVVLLASGLLLTAAMRPPVGVTWVWASGTGSGLQSQVDQALNQARAKGQPVVMDFYATWCAACNELDEKTWPSPQVQAAGGSFTFIKVDLSHVNPDDLDTNETVKRYQIQGMPTVLFFDAAGNLLEKQRVVGFMDPAQMAARLQQVAAK
jgi:thiol:disulfide interchange protein DsbD